MAVGPFMAITRGRASVPSAKETAHTDSAMQATRKTESSFFKAFIIRYFLLFNQFHW